MDVKIKISVDAQDALKNIKSVQGAFDSTSKGLKANTNTFVKLSKEIEGLKYTLSTTEKGTSKYKITLDKLATANSKLKDVTKDMQYDIKVIGSSFKDGVPLIDAYKSKIKDLKGVMSFLESRNVDVGMDKSIHDSIKGLRTLIENEEKYNTAIDKEWELRKKINKLMAAETGDYSEVLADKAKELEDRLYSVVKIEGDASEKAKKLARELAGVRAEMNKATKTNFTTRMSNLVKSFVSAQLVVYGIRKAFTTLTGTIKEASRVASEAEETYNLFITTFNNVENSALGVSNSMASSFGMAQSTAQKALGTFGDLAKGYSATDAEALKFAETAAKTTLDIVSFKNITGDLDTVFGNIASGLAGNVENFRKLGYIITKTEVDMNLHRKGLDKLTGSALQFAQIQERLNILVKKSANAQGDMLKTIDSTENVTRRLNEAWKQYLSFMGEDVNRTLTPIKRIFTEVLEQSNKLRQASKEIQSGASISNTFDLNQGKDYNTLVKYLSNLGGINGVTNTDIENTIRMFNPESSTLAKAIGDANMRRTMETGGYLDVAQWDKIYTSLQKQIEEEQKLKDIEEARTNTIDKLSTSFLNLTDAMASVKGVTLETFEVPDYFNKLKKEGAETIYGILLSNAMDEAVKSLSSANWKDFIDPITLQLSSSLDDLELEGFQTQLKSLGELYGQIYNEAYSDGILSESEDNRLSNILEKYRLIEKTIKSISDEKERQKNLDTAIGNANSSVDNYNSMLATMNMSERDKALYAANTNYASSLLYASSDSEITNLNAAFAILRNSIEKYYNALDEKTAKEKRDAINSSYIDAYAANKVALSQIGMNAWQLRKDNIERDGLANGLSIGMIQSLVMDDNKLFMAEQNQALKDSLKGGLGEIGQLYDAINLLSSGGGMGGIYSMLISLASSTELFQELSSIFSDYLVPILNDFLDPLMPIVKMLGETLGSLLKTVLIPLHPILKAISMEIAVNIGLIKTLVEFVSDSVRFVVGNIAKTILGGWNSIVKALGGFSIKVLGKKIKPFSAVDNLALEDDWAKDWANTDVFGNMVDNLKEMGLTLKDIQKDTFGIVKNTDKEADISVYDELLKSGIINHSQYTAMVSNAYGYKFDRMQSFGNGYYQNQANGTKVYNGDIAININGYNGDPDELAKEVIRKMEEQSRAGGYAFA